MDDTPPVWDPAFHILDAIEARESQKQFWLLDASQRAGNLIESFKRYALADGLEEVLNYVKQPYRDPEPKPPSLQMTIDYAATSGAFLA